MQRYKVGFGSVFSGQFRAVCINMLTYIMADHVSYFVDFYSSPACGCELYKQCSPTSCDVGGSDRNGQHRQEELLLHTNVTGSTISDEEDCSTELRQL